ncbi:MAG TPA: hypothetical protein VMT15_20885 [Bryobacteraceae bacterium]|nr:hypothetical protein [Bryobacteraceae bacterium]
MAELCWDETEGSELRQGDVLPGIHVPLFVSPFSENVPEEGAEAERTTEVQQRDVIVVSHTCDLLLDKIRFVALCPVATIAEFERDQPKMGKEWRNVQKGRWEGLHLLGSFTNPSDYSGALIVDFREIISLPRGYVENHAVACGRRHRLRSPFIEHFSQAFGKFYMRVALPEFVQLP